MKQSVKDILADNFWIMPATPEYIDKGVPYITSKNIKNGTIDFSKVNYISQEDYENISKNRPILVGDILISMIGTLGETAEVKRSDGLFYGQNMYLVRIDESKVNKRYFLNFFKSNFVKRALEGKQNQSTQKYLKANHIEDLIIPVPDVTKQELIAKQLDKLAYIITLRTNELKQLDELIKARFVEMFGNPITNPKGWDIVELGELTDIGSSKRIFEKEYVSEGIPFYRTKEIVELSKGNSVSTELFITEERFAEIKEKYGAPKNGDLLISAVGTIGVIWIVDGKNDFYFKDGNLIRVDGSEKFNSVYMKNLLEYLIDGYKKQMSTGTAYAALTISGLTKMKVYDIPMELQNQFADFVNQVDKSKVVYQGYSQYIA